MSMELEREVEELARELSRYTGETVSQAIRNALQERLQRVKRRRRAGKEELLRIGRECASLPVRDGRMPEEILGYEEMGLPD